MNLQGFCVAPHGDEKPARKLGMEGIALLCRPLLALYLLVILPQPRRLAMCRISGSVVSLSTEFDRQCGR